MKKTRTKRIIIGVIGPCILGTLFFIMAFYVSSLSNDSYYTGMPEYPKLLIFILMMSIFFMGIQSIVYSLVMEFLISKKIDNIYIFIGASVLLGAAAGMSLSLMGSGRIELAVGIGCATGLVLGCILYFLHDKNEQTPINANTSN